MSHDHPFGKPENVVKFAANGDIDVDEEQLKNMFLHEDVKYRSVVLFSIIGAFRRGKSYFLDYCLRFLYATYPSVNNPSGPISNENGWIGDEYDELKGFSWRSGATRDTSGIVVWNDVFLHTDEATGQKLAIFVMDTQGLFDNETLPIDNSRIFALGNLISSIQVLNLSCIVQEDQLQYLQFATEFAKFAASDSHGTAGKPFQNLMFLIRDWAYIDDHPLGIEGGEQYLEKFLKMASNQKDEIKSVREYIYNSFDNLSCSLLPHPGYIVAGGKKLDKKYEGNWSGMDKEFKNELCLLIEHLLKPNRLVSKKINGEHVMSIEFLEYILQYFKLFQSDKLPKAKSIYESTIEQQMNIVVNACFNKYKETIYANLDFIEKEVLIHIVHEMSKNRAIIMFKEFKKMGNDQHEAAYRKILEERIEDIFDEWKQQTIASVEKIKEEKEKTRLALEEKLRLQEEQIKSERDAFKRLEEIQKVKHDNVIKAQDVQIAQQRVLAEQARSKAMEAELAKDQAIREKVRALAERDEYKIKYDSKKSSSCQIL